MTCNLETSQFPESNIQLLLPFAHAAQGLRVVIKFLKQKWNLWGLGLGMFLWYVDNTLIIFCWASNVLLTRPNGQDRSAIWSLILIQRSYFWSLDEKRRKILCQQKKGEDIAFAKRNGGKYFDMESIFFVEEKKNRKLIGGKYLVKENKFWRRRRKKRKIFGEGKYLFLWRREAENENICWRKICLNGGA